MSERVEELTVQAAREGGKPYADSGRGLSYAHTMSGPVPTTYDNLYRHSIFFPIYCNPPNEPPNSFFGFEN